MDALVDVPGGGWASDTLSPQELLGTVAYQAAGTIALSVPPEHWAKAVDQLQALIYYHLTLRHEALAAVEPKGEA